MSYKNVYIFKQPDKFIAWFMKSGAGKDTKKDKLDDRIYTDKEKLLKEIKEFL